jgi:hypothetical protein
MLNTNGDKNDKMKKHLTLIVVLLLFLCSSFLSIKANAGEAGVGVINVPPKYGYIRVEQQDDMIRVYLNISDYNSWGDINKVVVKLNDYESEIAKFVFKQYENIDSYVEINQFSEIPEELDLLAMDKCFYEKSNDDETIDDRCDLKLRFVFKKTSFTGIQISIEDRDGSTAAEAYINYNTEDALRSGNNIVIPYIGNTIIANIPPYLVNLIALTTALVCTMYYFKKNMI